MTKTEELKPCPFCDGSDLIIKHCGEEDYHTIWCRHCGGKMLAKFSRKAAISSWNARAPQTTGWQPIATAPKDGTRILCFNPGNEERKPKCVVDYWNKPDIKRMFTGFGHENRTFWPHTHWQPLPPPPVMEDPET